MDETQFDLNALRLLASIDALGGFAKAADRLGLSRATASRRIAALEQAVGATLLERNARYVCLTADGETLLARTAGALREIDGAVDRLREGKREIAGVVRIATTATLAETILVPAIETLRPAHPELQFEILLDEDVVDIRRDRIDFALRAGALRDPSIIAVRIAIHRFSCWTTPAWRGEAQAPLLAYSPDRMGDASRAWLRVRDIRLVKTFVLSGLGEAWLPDSYCAAEAAAGALVRRDDQEVFDFNIFVVYPSRLHLTARARLAIDQIKKTGATTSVAADVSTT